MRRGFALLLFVALSLHAAEAYKVSATRAHHDTPILSFAAGTSPFEFVYNSAAVVPHHRHAGPDTQVQLFVRSQHKNATSGASLPSVVALATLDGDGLAGKLRSPLTEKSVIFQPEGDSEKFGVEDPRVMVLNGTYYMMYSAVQAEPKVVSRLSLATNSHDPMDESAWERHGPVVPKREWSKSGAIVVRHATPRDGNNNVMILPHYLLWGDSADVCALHIAVSDDLLHYNDTDDLMLKCRPDKFDSHLVEAGPPPLPLSDGNLFFIYNSARLINTSSSALEYNIGWAVLDKNDPTVTLARSDTPMLSPTLPWEHNGQVPEVVFCEGMWRLEEENTFGFVYGGADTNLGVGVVKVVV